MGALEQLSQSLIEISERLDRIEKLLQEKTTPQPSEEFWDIHEAGELLRLSVQTIYGLVHKREIPHNKKGNRLYFKKSELQQWMSEGRRRTMSEINNHN